MPHIGYRINMGRMCHDTFSVPLYAPMPMQATSETNAKGSNVLIDARRLSVLYPQAFRRGGSVRASPVSYTHLRAHETVLDLVCRLLLEKKNIQTKNAPVRSDVQKTTAPRTIRSTTIVQTTMYLVNRDMYIKSHNYRSTDHIKQY